MKRFVYLIAEAEADCDMNGLLSFFERYGTEVVAECAEAYEELGAHEIAAALRRVAAAGPDPSEDVLDAAGDLITERRGYDYERIRAVVESRLKR